MHIVATQTVDDVLSHKTDCSPHAITTLTERVRATENTEKLKQLLTGDVTCVQQSGTPDPQDGTPINTRDRARVALEGMGMYYTDDIETTMALVIGSDLTPPQSNWDTAKRDALRAEIKYFDADYEWNRYTEPTDTTDDTDDDDSGPSREQNTDSNGLAKETHKSEYDERRQEIRSQLPSRI